MTESGSGTRSTRRILVLGALVMMFVLGGLSVLLSSTQPASQPSLVRDNLDVSTSDAVRSTQGNNQLTPTATELVQQAGIPPIDAATPTETELATFALG